MHHRIQLALVALLAALVQPLAADTPQPRSIFDGKTLQGWQGNEKTWRVEDGAITGEIPDGTALKQNEFIYWDGELHDFELELEFRISGIPSANSGIQFRSQRLEDGHAAGYQADLDDGAVWLGRIYDEHGRALLVERGQRISISPTGKRWADVFAPVEEFQSNYQRDAWNTYRITARASHVEVWINGKLTSVLDDHETGKADLSGLLAFQMHSGQGPAKVQFRNIRVAHLGRTHLPPTPKTAAVETTPLVSLRPVGANGQPLNLGFETGTLADWTAEGDAWIGQPSRYHEPSTPRRKTELPTEPAGNFWLGPPASPSPRTGRLSSAPFEVTHRWASYLIGGGRDINQTRVELVDASDGKVIHTATGTRKNELRREVVDFSSSVGKKVFIRLVDNATEGPFDHVAFDDFVFHDRHPEFGVTEPGQLRQQESAVLWHLQPNPAKASAVGNLDAQKLVREMKLVDGFQAELIAAEPDVHQPIAFAFDERGRMWILEAYSYPNKQPAGKGKDRVLIFEDRDGDGSFETRKVFVEGLNLASGIEIGFGGVWVGAAPDLLFIPDRNRDDIPDGPPEVLLDGWGYQDTHETLNSFSWGPDGWLYGTQGVFTQSHVGKPGTPQEKRVTLRAGVWRYHPTRHEFEVFASGGSNQWGIDFNEFGHLFMTHCRSFFGGGGTTHVIRNGHYWNQSNSDYAPFVFNQAPAFAPALKNYLSSSARYDSGEGGAGKPGTTAVYGGHSHVGTMIYLGDNWPAIYRDHLFTLNLHGHQLNHQHNVRQGSGYETFHAGYDLLHVPDLTFMGVDLQYGPDGAVYIIDWCDHQHCHTPNPEAWEKTNGRIYRMSWKETWKAVQVNLLTKSDLELAELHTHRNEWYVRTARRLLQERAARGPIQAAALSQLNTQAATATEISAQLRAIWTLHCVGAIDASHYDKLLDHPSDLVRSAAIQLATDNPREIAVASEKLVDLAKNDPSPTVRLAIASALPVLDSSTRWTLASALSLHPEDAGDRFLPKMIWFGLAPLVNENLSRALDIAGHSQLPSLAESVLWYAAQSAEGRDLVVPRLAEAPLSDATKGLLILAFALENENRLSMPKSWAKLAQRYASSPDTSPEGAAIAGLSALFGDESVLATSRARLADTTRSLSDRQNALALLKRARDPAAIPLYITLLADPAFQKAVIPLLSGADNQAAASELIRHFSTLSDPDKAAALATLTSHPTQALALLEATKKGSFEKKNLTALHARQLRNLRNDGVNALLDQVWGKTAESTADLQTAIARYQKLYHESPRWAFRATEGRKIYQNLCAVCHTLNGVGGKMGPDLTGSWRNGVDYFIENIVDPNAVVGLDYQLNLVTKRDGTVVSGTVERETETAVIVRTVTETITVPKEQTAQRELSTQSLMPPGLLDALSEREAVELLMYLTSRE